MSQPVELVSPTPTSYTPSSGPMSDGMIYSLSGRQHRPNDTNERVCMFALCLMFIGVPIFVVGIICLSFSPLLGTVMMGVGLISSASGALVAVLTAVLNLCIKESTNSTESTSAAIYADSQPIPGITIQSDNYIQRFDDNLCEEEPPKQLSTNNLPDYDSKDFMKKLDPIFWSNYPEAQNPKSYLNSFGELPKVIPSPEPSTHHKSSGHKKSSKRVNYEQKICRKISQTMKIGRKKRTISRTELTRDYDDSDDTSSSPSTCSRSISPAVDRKANYFKIDAKELGDKSMNSIITIEKSAPNSEETVDEDIVVYVAESSVDNTTTNDNTDNEFHMRVDDKRSEELLLNCDSVAKSNGKQNANIINDKQIEKSVQIDNDLSDECEQIELTVRGLYDDMDDNIAVPTVQSRVEHS